MLIHYDGLDLSKGDSGSWVMTDDGQVIGHLVATNAFGEALLIPMSDILQDIKSKLNVQKVSLPSEPITMTLVDGPLRNMLKASNPNQNPDFTSSLHVKSIVERLRDRRRCSTITTSLNHQHFSGIYDSRANMKREFEFEHREWETYAAECDFLLRDYQKVKSRLSKESLPAILEYQWIVQEGYQLKTIEDQREEDKVRWSEQRARWAYQDKLVAVQNEHWEPEWWDAYIRQWKTDIEAWQGYNNRLQAHMESLRRCKELLEFHERKQPAERKYRSSAPSTIYDTALLSSGPRRQLDILSNWPRPGRRPLLSLGRAEPGSVDSGYGSSASMTPRSCASSNSEQSHPARYASHPRIPGMLPLRPTPRQGAGIGGEDEGIFELNEE
jgi:hypothetical protein